MSFGASHCGLVLTDHASASLHIDHAHHGHLAWPCLPISADSPGPWQAWGKLSEQEQVTATRVHKLDCYQHLRNIFLKEMSAAQAKHVAEELQPHLDAFSSWERMSTEYSQLLRAAYKEFHHGNKYATKPPPLPWPCGHQPHDRAPAPSLST